MYNKQRCASLMKSYKKNNTMKSHFKSNIIYLLSMANRFAERRLNEALSPFEIKGGQVGIIFLLYETPGITQKDICDLTGIEQPTIANTLKRMERDNLITRKMDDKDKRIMHNYLSEDIIKIIPQIEEALSKAEEKILKRAEIESEDAKLDLLKISKSLDPEWRFVSRWGSENMAEESE